MVAYFLLTAASIAGALSSDPGAKAHAKHHRGNAPAVVTITARDYAFDAPDSIAAGVTTLHLVNRGPDLHHVALIKLAKGKSSADFYAMMKSQKPDAPPPSWISEVAGPNAPAPGKQSNVTLDLAPGQYMLVCFIPAPDGTPHAMKGMVHALTVAAGKSSAVMPKSDVTMTLDEFRFGFDRPISAGSHTIRVKNVGAQSHEVELVKLAPGKTAQQMVEWVDKRNGPPPGLPMGGVVGLRSGAEAQFSADFEPGTYALICFFPDSKDGKPHFVHGMIKEFTVAK